MTATTTHDESVEPDGATPAKGRFRASYAAITLGILFALITVGSGILATVTQWHDDSPVTRETFGGVPSALKAVFYIVVPVLIVYGGVLFSFRVKNWERGKPDNRATTKKNAKRRLADFRAGVYMQTLLRDPAAGIMHSLIYFSFLILLAVTTVLEINHQLPVDLKFLNGRVYEGYSFVGDAAGLTLTIGVLWAIVRRYVQRPYRIRIKTKPEHAVILVTLLALPVTGFLTEGYRIAETGMPSFEKWSFIGYPLGLLVDGSSHLVGWHQVWWIAARGDVPHVPSDPAGDDAASHVHVAAEHVPTRSRPAQGRHEAHAEPDGDRARVVRCQHHRGLHLEAAPRHRRLHDVRPLHRGVSRPTPPASRSTPARSC